MTEQSSNQQIPALTVSQATNAIKSCLEATFPALWIQGEISNCKIQSSGHLYFSLKDSKAQISAVMFRGEMTKLKTAPKDGDNVIIHGDLNVYPPTGKYQIIVNDLKQIGLGELLLKLEELKRKLHKLGWFRPENKKKLPKFPKRIGVVTSPTGAVIQDILHILTRRVGGFQLLLNPVKVQGEGAAQEIAKAINLFNQYDLVDVMIVGRGGGSLEDLWAFNEEIVAEAIFNSRIPVISAVGHETDHCIADYVADVRAPTPSAAAEIVIAEKVHLLSFLSQTRQRIHQQLLHSLKSQRQQLKSLYRHPLFQSPYKLLGPSLQQLDSLKQGIDDSIAQKIAERKNTLNSYYKHLQALRPNARIAHYREILAQKRDRLNQSWKSKLNHNKNKFNTQLKQKQLDQAWQRVFNVKQERLLQLTNILSTINPKNLLSKGYSILFSEKENCVITSVSSVKKEDEISILLADGKLITKVKEIFPK